MAAAQGMRNPEQRPPAAIRSTECVRLTWA